MTAPVVTRDVTLPVGSVFWATVRTLHDPAGAEPIPMHTRWVGASTVELEYLDQDVGAIRINGTLVAIATPDPGEHWAPERARFGVTEDYTVALGVRLAITAGDTVNPGGGTPEDPGPEIPAPGGSVIVDADTAPTDQPVALQRGSDGRFRPDRAAIAERPDRAEVAATVGTEVAAHSINPAPHPAYDDMPSLSLLFLNRLV